MRTTISVLKADIGSIGGHIKPSRSLVDKVRSVVEVKKINGTLIDCYVGSTGDDIAMLVTHDRGVGNPGIHKLGWDAFIEGTAVAKKQGLYGAGQDLLKDAFSGNIKGMGPAVAEMEIDERPNESFVFFAADKTDPGAYNWPLYLSFADPRNTSGLLLSPKLTKGFKYTVMDVMHTEGEKVIELNAPEELYGLAALLRDTERYIIESIHSRASGAIAAAISTTRLHNIAGIYTGKDDPVMLVRVQGDFPATGEVLASFAGVHYVAGGMRGSHNCPLMPCRLGTDVSYFDGPPVVTGAAFSMHEGKLTEPADVFAHPFWDYIRAKASEKAIEIRRQGFSGPAMLPISELEYGGIRDILAALEVRFKIKE